MLSDEQGQRAVRYARQVVEHHVRGEEIPELEAEKPFTGKAGAFVTLNCHPSGDLRGCIGIPEPSMQLAAALREAATSATRDPRFPPLQPDELDTITVEVTVLTPPEKIECDEPENYPSCIEVGRDGLIAERHGRRGLLLPQVPVQQGWDAETFVSQTCWKAGLPPDAWLDDDTRLYRFQGQVFRETEPHGDVVRETLDDE
ncbi:MAG: TIGR00296 family protein [Thermoplasmatota archaeon]